VKIDDSSCKIAFASRCSVMGFAKKKRGLRLEIPFVDNLLSE